MSSGAEGGSATVGQPVARRFMSAAVLALLSTAGGVVVAEAAVVVPGQDAGPAGSGIAIPADVRAALAAGPTDLFVTVDTAVALGEMRAATRKGLDRASRQAAATRSASAYASAKRTLLAGRRGVTTKRDYRQLPVQVVRVESTAALLALAAAPGVSSIALPKTRQADVAVSDNLAVIRQPDASSGGGTGAGVRVAVLDTGVDVTRPGAETTFGNCTAGPGTNTCRIKAHFNATGVPQPRDVDPAAHGTNVAGIVATVAPGTDLSVYNVFRTASSAFDTDILDALDHVAANAAATNTRAVNLSLGDVSYNAAACSESNFTATFATLRGLGVLPVVAAGNSAHTAGVFSNGVADPACAPGAVSVGAMYSASIPGPVGNSDCQDPAPALGQPVCFSQTGPTLGVLAPGAFVTAAGIEMSGTSQASPHVAAAAAILASANPAANAAAISNALTTTGPVVTDARTATTVRRLDLVAALAMVGTMVAPDAPTTVLAVAGTSSAAITWQPGASNGGRAMISFDAIASPGGATCSSPGPTGCTIVGLTNGTAYTVTVTANNGLASAASVPTAPVTPVGAPSVLLAPTAVAGNAQATVSWTLGDSGGSPITGYTVTANPGGATCVTAALSCTIAGLANGTSYLFTVTASNVVATSAPSAPSAATVPASVPAAPTSVTAAAGVATATVSWVAPVNSGGLAITGYTVVAAPGGASCTTAGPTSCAIGGLVNGTSYTFSVTATNALGVGAGSAPSAAVTPLAPPPVIPPPVIAPPVIPKPAVPGKAVITSASRGHLSAVVTWRGPVGGPAATGYRVVASPGGTSCTALAAATRCTVPGLVNGRTYRFTATSSNAAGAGPASALSGPVVPAPVPGVPTRVVVRRGNRSATVSWVAPKANGTPASTGYRVVASPGGRNCTVIRGLRCAVTGLVNGRSYSFAVVALNRIGASPASPAVSAIPATAPGAVRALMAAFPAAGRASLTWAAPVSNGGLAATYAYRTSTDGGRTWGRWVSVGALRAASVTGLVKGRVYAVEVRAVTAAGAGPAARINARPTR